MARKRYYPVPYTTLSQPVSKAWGRGYNGPPLMGTGSIAQQTGANAALAEFFGMMLEHRFDVMDDRRDAAIDKADDFREYNLDLGRYDTQHENYMDELEARQDAEGISKSAQGDTNPVNSIFDFAAGLGDAVARTAENVGEVVDSRSPDGKPSADDYLKKAKALQVGGPRLNARFPLMTGNNPSSTAALADFFKMMLEERWNETGDLREARIDRRDDLREYKLDTGRYDAKHENQMDEIFARTYGADAVRDDSQSASQSSDPISSMLGSFMAGDPAPFTKEGKTNVTGISKSLGDTVGAAVGSFFDFSEHGVDAPRDEDDEKAVGILERALKSNPFTAASYEVGKGIYDSVAGNDSPEGDAVTWAIDKLSRPLFGVNEARSRFYAQDESAENETPGWLRVLSPIVNLEGADPIGALKGTDSDEIGDIAGGLWSGFIGKDKTLSSEIIAENAARDTETNYLDNPKYQIWAGLGADLAVDPLNFVGVGLVKAPVMAGAKGVKTFSKIRNAEQAEQLLRETRLHQMTSAIAESGATKGYGRVSSANEEIEIPAEELFNMLGGNYKGSASLADTLVASSRASRNADSIIGMVRRQELTKPEVSSAMRDLRGALHRERNRVLNEFGTDGMRDFLARDLGIKISQGKASAEDLDDLDTFFTSSVLADKGIVEKANSYENALFSALNNDISPEIANPLKSKWDIPLTKNGKLTIDAVEAKHTALRQAVLDAEDRLARGVTGGSEHSVTSARRELQRFEKDLNQVFDTIKTDLKDINDLLGPKWKGDYRFTDDEGIKMWRQARQIVAKQGTETGKLAQRIKQTEGQLAGLRKAINTTRRNNPSASVKGFEAKIAMHEGRLRRDTAALNRAQAATFIKVVKSRINEGAGFKEFTNAKEAKAIDDVIRSIQAERGGEISSKSDEVAIGVRTDYEDTPSDINWMDFVDENGQIIDHPEFGDRAMQLDTMERSLRGRLKGMRNPNALPDIEPASRKMLSDIPAALRDADGKLVTEVLKDHIQFNKRTGGVNINYTGHVDTDEWLQAVGTVLDHSYQDTYVREWQNLTRRLNETTEGEALKQQMSVQDEMLANMFFPSSGGLRAGTKLAGPLTPGIKLGDESLRLGSNELRAAYSKGKLGSIPKSKKTSDINLQVVDDLVNDALNKTTTVNHQKVSRLRDYLIDYGKSIPDSPTKARDWIVRNAQSVRLALEPQEIEAVKLFKNKNGFTPREAKVHRDRILGRIVVGKGRWEKANPKGITLDEYMYLATNNKDTFHQVFAHGPFNLRIGKESSKQLTARNASPDEWKKWTSNQYELLTKMSADEQADMLRKSWDATRTQQAKNAPKELTEAKKTAKAEAYKKPTNEQQREVADNAYNSAFQFVEDQLRHNKLYAHEYDEEFSLFRELGGDSTPEELHRALKFYRGDKYADEVRRVAEERSTASPERIKELDEGLKVTKAKLKEQEAAAEEAFQRAKDGRQMFEHRLKEDAALRILAMGTLKQQKSLTFNVIGHNLRIPGSRQLFNAMEKMGGLNIIKQTKQTYADAFNGHLPQFSSPSKRLSADSQLVRARALSLTPNIIEYHIKDLHHSFADVPLDSRIKVFKNYLKGNGVPVGKDASVAKAIDESFQGLLPYFKGEVKVGDSKLTIHEINKYLPAELTLKHANIKTVQDLINSMRKGKDWKSSKINMRDPYRMSWELRVATEQAIARKALIHTINNSFGVKDVVKSGQVLDADAQAMVKKLNKLGWAKHNELGNTHLFPPEVITEIDQLLKMLEPRNVTRIGHLIDKVTGYWKTSATIYNPGYYTRNGVGEIMSSWFAGVNDPRVYKAALGVMKYARHDGKELAALKSQFPLLEHLRSGAPTGNEVVTKLRNGRKVTRADLWVMYHDQGLKTGFINTEFDKQYGTFSKLGDKIRSSPMGAISKGHMKVRNFGEGYEDYLRMAHFIHAVKNSKAKTLAGAAKDAAKAVRKYHFDYTDFNNFEKMYMMRLFPFYKWTRKALPLMATMLFTKPGKVMAYPKVMNAYSQAEVQGSTEELVPDPNGFAPNYTELVPQWIRDLWGYKIAEDSRGDSTYFNMATPQMDVYKGIAHPDNLASGLLHPGLKQGYEYATGETLGMGIPVEGAEEHGYSALRTVPVTNMFGKWLRGMGKGEDDAIMEPGQSPPIDETFASFLTGLGYYENNDARKIGEMIRRSEQ